MLLQSWQSIKALPLNSVTSCTPSSGSFSYSIVTDCAFAELAVNKSITVEFSRHEIEEEDHILF
jgi:hypothetical protein